VTRQRLLICVLAVVVLFGLPVYFMDGALAAGRARLEAEQAALAPLRQQAAAVRALEADLAERSKRSAAVQNRLIAAQPFATIQAELTAAAKQSGVTLGSVVLEGPAVVPDWPGVSRYQATLTVKGDRNQYLAFLRLLEDHRLLIELPEVNLRMQTPAAAKSGVPGVEQVLELGFFVSSPGGKP
jgi:Tfp pilus assembly protein PilO